MNLLIIGAGKGGSWAMRGIQLGAAIGARVTSAPTNDDLAWAEIVVLVKRYGARCAESAHRSGKPVVWDALDFWRQPAENGLSEQTARHLLEVEIEMVRPNAVIGATEAMARAAGGYCLPHHSWAGLAPLLPRVDVQTVAYEGGAVYLGRWAGVLERLCAERGWKFVINPPDLSAADIIVAFRDGPWDGWMCREWKSGVKVVNAIAAGRPLIAQDSAAWRELQPEGSIVESPEALEAALDNWASYKAREEVSIRCAQRAPAFTLSAVAKQYLGILETRGLACPA